MAAPDLFRREALDAKRQSWLGTVSLAQPFAPWFLAGASLASAFAILAFLYFGTYTQRSRVSGELVPDLGLATVVAPTNGVVDRLYPKEGDRVSSSDPLVVVTVPHATASGDDAVAGILAGIDARIGSLREADGSQAELVKVQEAGYREQLKAARESLRQVRAELATRQKQVALAGEAVERFRALGQGQYVSESQIHQQEQALLEQTSTRQALAMQGSELEGQVAQIEQSLRELPSQRAVQRAANARDLALLRQERIQRRASSAVLVRSPVRGMVSSRLIETGQVVQAGQPLMSLLPAGSRLQAQLMVPSRAIGFVEPGDRVLLRYQAFPYQKFGQHEGVVVRISRNAVGQTAGAAGAGAPRDTYYRVLVDIRRQSVSAYGREQALRSGMLLEADILGDHRRLYEWILEPLYSLARSH